MREHGYRFCTVFLGNGLEFAGAGVQRLIPGDSLPFGGAAFADIFQWVFEAVRIIEQFDAGIAAGADRDAVVDRFRISFQLDQTAITDFSNQLAAPETHLADSTDRGLGVFETARGNQRCFDNS